MVTPIHDNERSNVNPVVDWVRPIPYRVTKRLRENGDCVTLVCEPKTAATQIAPTFRPGQFNMMYVHGVGEIAISISGDPTRNSTFTHTIRSVGAVSNALTRLRRGDELGIRGPFGRPWPLEVAEGKHLMIVCGGIGLAPLRPVLYHAAQARPRFGDVTLLYGARSPSDLIYRRELESWKKHHSISVALTVDHAYTGWRHHVGVVTSLIAPALRDPKNTVAFLCGPEIMMRVAARELLEQGVSATNLFLSMERNMQCAVGICGHCLFGPHFICKNGPVFAHPEIAPWLTIREL